MSDAHTIIATAISDAEDAIDPYWEAADAVLVALTTAGYPKDLGKDEFGGEAWCDGYEHGYQDGQVLEYQPERYRQRAVVSREPSRSALIELRAWIYEHTLIEAGTNNRIVDQALLLQQLRAALAVPTPTTPQNQQVEEGQ